MLATSKFPSPSVNPANQAFEPKGLVSKGSKGIGLGKCWFTILISLWRASILGVLILPLMRLVIARTLPYYRKYSMA
jgi:hypothetical protein